jgi:hypothetical protein
MPLLVIAFALILWATWNSRAGLMNWVRDYTRQIRAEFAWQMPDKQETSAEWFREIRGKQNWCVRAAA